MRATDLLSGVSPHQGHAPNGKFPAGGKIGACRADAEAALAAYNETAKRCGLSIPRKPEVYIDAVGVRLREGSLDEWREMLGIVERSPHLCGENDRGWKADLGWLSKRENYAKVLDGRYLRSKPKPDTKPMRTFKR